MNPILDPSQLGLRDIHLPSEISWWPFAVGWWLLGIVIFGVGIFFVIRHFRYRSHRAACRELRKLADAVKAGSDPRLCAVQASTTLRRFAMTLAKDSSEVAGLVGERWLSYLDSRSDGNVFRERTSQLLLTAPYRSVEASASEDSLDMCAICVDWVKAQPLRG